MKLFILVILFAMSLTGGVANAQSCPSESTQVLSSCKFFSTFDATDILREPNAFGAYDRIYFDFNYLVREQILVTTYDRFGYVITQQQLTRSLPAWEHFEVSERYGNEATIKTQVERYLKNQSIFTCSQL